VAGTFAQPRACLALDRLHQQLTTPTAAVAVTALADDDEPGGTARNAEASPAAGRAPRVLHGLGGVGKTQLAAEYAYRHAGDYPIRWWVPAEQPAAIAGRLVALARQLGIPEQTEQTQTVAALLGELGRRHDWLLVFDNAEDPHDLHPYWPSTDLGGRVLVTSRNPNWQPLAATLPVDVLPRADAVAFLHRRTGLNPDDADRLAEALGDLPLALEQAAAYLDETATRQASTWGCSPAALGNCWRWATRSPPSRPSPPSGPCRSTSSASTPLRQRTC
jgi:hypothetical protein